MLRKEPATTAGKFTNLLLMNEDAVLVDRTAAYVTDSDIPGDEGLLTPTAATRRRAAASPSEDPWLVPARVRPARR